MKDRNSSHNAGVAGSSPAPAIAQADGSPSDSAKDGPHATIVRDHSGDHNTPPAKPPAWIPIPARTPLSLCKSCKAPIYWSVTALGRNVPVSIALEGSI